jgi:hypothetical protein
MKKLHKLYLQDMEDVRDHLINDIVIDCQDAIDKVELKSKDRTERSKEASLEALNILDDMGHFGFLATHELETEAVQAIKEEILYNNNL